MARILVIDDSDEMRKLIKTILIGEGHEIFQAKNGNEALTVFDKNSIDLLILDIVMPEKDGLETITELRKNYGRVKIIAISGGGRIDAGSYLSIAKKLGVKETLSKPFSINQLKESVNKVLSA